MRIISDFKDYYDTVMVHGTDPNCIYNRKQIVNMMCHSEKDKWHEAIRAIQETRIYKSFKEPYINRLFADLYNDRKRSWTYQNEYTACWKDRYGRKENVTVNVDPIIVIFCGEVKFGFFINTTYSDDFYVWNSADFVKIMSTKFEDFFKDEEDKKHCQEILDKEFFSHGPNYMGDDIDNWHHEFGYPIVAFESTSRSFYSGGRLKDKFDYGRIVINPILQNIEFQRVYDAYTAYQKLNMFINGILSGQSPKMVAISDKDRLAKHGFDTKMGFRKRKPKK